MADPEPRRPIVNNQLFQPQQGFLAGHHIQLAAPLPAAPQQAPLVDVTFLPLPDSEEEALQLGRALGLHNPQLHTAPQDPALWTIRGENSANITYRTHRRGASAGLFYAPDDRRLPQQGTPLPFQKAAQIAVNFLAGADLLPPQFALEEQPHSGGEPLRIVKIVPLVLGAPLITERQNYYVGVLPDGSVAQAHVNPFSFTIREESVAVRPAQQALNDLLAGIAPLRFSYDVIADEAGSGSVRGSGAAGVVVQARAAPPDEPPPTPQSPPAAGDEPVASAAMTPPSGMPQSLIIQEALLVYTAQSAQRGGSARFAPYWLFRGQSEGGQVIFSIRTPARP